MLLTALLAATLSQAVEEPFERDLSFSVEVTGGRQLGASGFVDYGVLPWLYLNVGYSLLKTPALEATDTGPAVPTSATHVFSGGVDWTPGRHFSLSLLMSGSPKSTDQVVLNPNARVVQLTVSTWRSSVGGTLMAAWMSGGLSDFEWVVDGGLTVTSNTLGKGIRSSGPGMFEAHDEDNLIAYRGQAGISVTLFDRTDVSLRGGISAYSSDPLTAGRFTEDEVKAISKTLAAGAEKFTDALAVLTLAAQQAATRIGQADALSGYASAPLYVEAKLQVRHRFTPRISGQVGWTWNRYVPTAGYANIFSTRATFKLGDKWRLWAGTALQLDQSVDHPTTRPAISGLVTVGVELTL